MAQRLPNQPAVIPVHNLSGRNPEHLAKSGGPTRQQIKARNQQAITEQRAAQPKDAT